MGIDQCLIQHDIQVSSCPAGGARDNPDSTQKSDMDDDFVYTHLSAAPEGWLPSVDDRLLARATSNSAAHNDALYIPLASVMTKISTRIHSMSALVWLDFVR